MVSRSTGQLVWFSFSDDKELAAEQTFQDETAANVADNDQTNTKVVKSDFAALCWAVGL